jgi:hypothetical protein
MGMLTAVDVEKTYQRNGAQSKNVVIELDHDGYDKVVFYLYGMI